MIIKKFQADTEQDAILQAKEEMGNEAVVMNIKTIKHRGIMRFFKKDIVEVTAALEERNTTRSIPVQAINAAVGNDTKSGETGGNQGKTVDENEQKSTAIEEKLDNLQNMLESRMKKMNEQEKNEGTNKDEKRFSSDGKVRKDDNTNGPILKLIYKQMIENEVDEKYATQLIGEVESSLKKETSMDSILSAIYQKIILKLGTANEIKLEKGKTKVVFFVGPTGVGKTTTIAKIASEFKLEKDANVAMVTSDTYRIAAVEQLKTYANILNIPVNVVYTVEEFNDYIDKCEKNVTSKKYDLILIDTAGRSHKNKEQCQEVIHLIKDCVLGEKYDKTVYLVLSAATKYKDLLNIVEVYNELGDYSIIFTKLDETSSLGNILNIRMKTNEPLSYVTSGQTVPDDISIIDAQKLTKNILGGGE